MTSIIRLVKFMIFVGLLPILPAVALIRASWNPYRFFFKRRFKLNDGRIVYTPYFSPRKYSKIKMKIAADIRKRHDLRTTKGKKNAFYEQTALEAQIEIFGQS